MRGMTIQETTEFVVEECGECGIQFAMPQQFRRKRLNDHSLPFWCPNGCRLFYIGKTAAEKERERARQLERHIANQDEVIRSEKAAHTVTKRKLSTTKGQLTKTRKRVANGVCPCCHRTFAQLQRHMKGQHPDYVEAVQ